MNPNCLLFSQRERERERENESPKSSREWRWSGGAIVLGKLSMPRSPVSLDNSKAKPIALAVGAGGGCLDIFKFVYLFSFLSPSFGDGPI